MDIYIDDKMTRGNKKQISRILEVKLEDGSYSSIIPPKMNKAGFKLKTIVASNMPMMKNP